MSHPFVLNLIPAIEDVAPRNPKGAGRKPISTVNPIAHIARELLFDTPEWMRTIIFGSCLTAAGQSQNVCNVSMRDVRGALLLENFKVQTLVDTGVKRRQAERIIKAARHAAHGIHFYLLQHPKLLRRYEDSYNCKLESRLAYSHADLAPYKPLQEVPEHIMNLYHEGDYLAYGKALRALRLESGDTSLQRGS